MVKSQCKLQPMTEKTHLNIDFVGRGSYQLNRVVYQSPLSLEPRISIRAREVINQKGVTSFNWTASVRALCIFLVRTKISRFEGQAEYGNLSGKHSSPAASLDYALARMSNWIVDMFGVDSKGMPIARKLIRRINPEQKRPGPVVLYWNGALLSPEQIHISIEGHRVMTLPALLELEKSLSERWSSSAATTTKSETPWILEALAPELPVSPYPFNISEVRTFFCSLLKQEIQSSLSDLTIFSSQKTAEHIQYLKSHPEFSPCGAENLRRISRLKDAGIARDRLGLMPHKQREEAQLALNGVRVFVPGVCAGTMALFYYLKYIRKFDIDIVYQFAHSNELLEHLQSDRLHRTRDFAVLGVGQTANLLSTSLCRSFEIVSFMPKISFHVLSKTRDVSSDALSTGDYLFMSNSPSSSQFYFRDLIRWNLIAEKKVAVHYMEPDQVTAALMNADDTLRTLLWFPHYHFNCAFNGCAIIDNPQGGINYKDNFLFCHKELGIQAPAAVALDSAIRDAWLSLRLEPHLLGNVVQMMVSDVDYLRYIARVSGLYHLEEGRLQELLGRGCVSKSYVAQCCEALAG